MKTTFLFFSLLFTSGAFAQHADDFTLIHEITSVDDGQTGDTKFTRHTQGVFGKYYQKTKSGFQTMSYHININPSHEVVNVYSYNSSAAGSAFSKEKVLKKADINFGKLLAFDPNSKSIYMEVYDTKTGEKQYTLTPNASPIQAFEKTSWEGLHCRTCRVGMPGWDHRIGTMSVFNDHAVIDIATNNNQRYYYNPTLVPYDHPEQMVAVTPKLPELNTQTSERKSTWDYCGSTNDQHFYFRGFSVYNKKTGADSCINMVAVVNHNSEVVRTFTINMTMPGMSILKYNLYSDLEGRNGNFIDNQYEHCLYMTALGEDKNDNYYIVIKKISYEGKLLWESALKVADKKIKNYYSYSGVEISYNNSNKVVLTASGIGTLQYIFDNKTGEVLKEVKIKVGNTTDVQLDLLDKKIADKIQQFMTANKDLKSVRAFYPLNDKEYFVAFMTKRSGVKIYALKS